MTETKTDPWEALRKPFPAERILKLPATNKRPELDYVSHADVTDRLLQVDPSWSWEWGVNDPQTGLPSKALSLIREDRIVEGRDGREFTTSEWSLWMALTVNGVTRRDVGYAPADKDEALKHVVSDAIRRCAMRHGVALDLWQKDDAATVKAEAGPVVSCPQCGKPLRERNGTKGPFVGCSGYPACKFTANGTMDQFTGEADVDPESIPDFGQPATSSASTSLVAVIRGLLPTAPKDRIRDAFASVEGGAACLAPVGDGQWKIRGAALAALSDEAKRAIITNLSDEDVDPVEMDLALGGVGFPRE